jgi:pyridoxine 5-phosphate synthase
MKRYIKLGVNVDHVAQIRENRGTKYPDPVFAAYLAELAGADQITVHLREDRRHIKNRDLEILRRTVSGDLNLEMAATEEMLEIVKEIKPEICTLVPEKREEKTTEGGLLVSDNMDFLRKYIRKLKDAGSVVSIFVDPDENQIKACSGINADRIEIHTGSFADQRDLKQRKKELSKIRKSAGFAAETGLSVAAGHGLNYDNVLPVIEIEQIDELNIGHSIVARAVFVGFERAVKEMIGLIR